MPAIKMNTKTAKSYNKVVDELRKRGYLPAGDVGEKSLKEGIDRWLVDEKRRSEERVKEAKATLDEFLKRQREK